jgi:hypothetical protein
MVHQRAVHILVHCAWFGLAAGELGEAAARRLPPAAPAAARSPRLEEELAAAIWHEIDVGGVAAHLRQLND